MSDQLWFALPRKYRKSEMKFILSYFLNSLARTNAFKYLELMKLKMTDTDFIKLKITEDEVFVEFRI